MTKKSPPVSPLRRPRRIRQPHSGSRAGKREKKTPLRRPGRHAGQHGRNLRKGELLQITFYDRDCYRTILGTLEMVDSIGRRLCLEGKKIDFEDIWEIKGR